MGVISTAFLLLLGAFVALMLFMSGRRRPAMIIGVAVGSVFVGFGALIAFGVLFGD